jgi:hypothetical protein
MNFLNFYLGGRSRVIMKLFYGFDNLLSLLKTFWIIDLNPLVRSEYFYKLLDKFSLFILCLEL